MAVALVAIALWAGAGVDKALHEQLDRSLSSTYELQSDALTLQAELSPLPGEDRRLIERINRLVVGRDSSGRIVQANTGLARDLPLDSGAFRRALGSGRVVVDAKWRGRAVRTFYGPAPAGARPVAVVEVAAFLAPLQAARRQVLLRVGATALLGALASLIGAAWLTRSALEPVAAIARQAGAIQGARTGQRIKVHADVLELRGLIEVLNEMLGRLERSYEW
ncbi:MAG TPA: hypothetical protein VFR62_11190, partial [Gemmatimonadales bacterium]|nr:hypothetical protein [Gemmatimonadales bacterium]